MKFKHESSKFFPITGCLLVSSLITVIEGPQITLNSYNVKNIQTFPKNV